MRAARGGRGLAAGRGVRGVRARAPRTGRAAKALGSRSEAAGAIPSTARPPSEDATVAAAVLGADGGGGDCGRLPLRPRCLGASPASTAACAPAAASACADARGLRPRFAGASAAGPGTGGGGAAAAAAAVADGVAPLLLFRGRPRPDGLGSEEELSSGCGWLVRGRPRAAWAVTDCRGPAGRGA
jgi:hypothetical protein